MKLNLSLLLCFIAVFSSCVKPKSQAKTTFSQIILEPIIEQDSISIRAIDVRKENVVFSGSPNFVARLFADGSLQQYNLNDSVNIMDYRGVSFIDNDTFVAISAGNPAQLFRIENNEVELVYSEVDEQVFYDAIHFYDEQNGIAFGDAMNGCMSILTTNDAGKTWEKQLCDNIPKALDNEGAYAASNTNIEIIDDYIWLASGTRIYSSTKGKLFTVSKTPIIQGEGAQGIYSIDFYNKQIGVAFGGDYTQPNANKNNFMMTKNGGTTWELVNGEQQPGYRSCIQFIPNTNGKGIMVVGFNGIDISNDLGKTWHHISDEPFYSFRFVSNNSGVLAGKGKIARFRLQ